MDMETNERDLRRHAEHSLQNMPQRAQAGPRISAESGLTDMLGNLAKECAAVADEMQRLSTLLTGRENYDPNGDEVTQQSRGSLKDSADVVYRQIDRARKHLVITCEYLGY